MNHVIHKPPPPQHPPQRLRDRWRHEDLSRQLLVSQLVQRLADTQWRLLRIPALEMALFARARALFGEKFSDYDPQTAATLLEAEALVVNHKELRNLHLEERRLRLQYQDDLSQLGALKSQDLYEQARRTGDARRAETAERRRRARQTKPAAEFFEKLAQVETNIQNLSPDQLDREMDALEAAFPYPPQAA